MATFERLQQKFGKPHPALEHYEPIHPRLQWLQLAFLRMHRRRQLSETGLQPLSHSDIINYAEKILRLSPAMTPVFVRVIEETDNAVLYDYYQRNKSE